MAEEGGPRYHNAILTFRPDNFFTIGLMFVIVYLAGALLAQGAMRIGLLPSPAPAAPARAPAPGTVAAA